MADPVHVARLTATAPSHDEAVALLVESFTGCAPDIFDVLADTSTTNDLQAVS